MMALRRLRRWRREVVVQPKITWPRGGVAHLMVTYISTPSTWFALVDHSPALVVRWGQLPRKPSSKVETLYWDHHLRFCSWHHFLGTLQNQSYTCRRAQAGVDECWCLQMSPCVTALPRHVSSLELVRSTKQDWHITLTKGHIAHHLFIYAHRMIENH
jgi:hypothetical protein